MHKIALFLTQYEVEGTFIADYAEVSYICMTDRKNRDAKARLGLFVFYCVIKNRKKMMELSELTAISPVDGRYRSKCEVLADYFSEFALIRYRVMVEVEYFIALCELPLPQLADVDASAFEGLRDLYRDFSEADALRVKEIP